MKQHLILDDHSQLLKAKTALIHAYNNTKTHEIEIKEYKRDRSLAQNRLQFHWYAELCQQAPKFEQTKGWTASDFRAYNKLEFAVEILKADPDFYELWQMMTGHLSTEYKLKAALKMEMTSIMNVEQMTWYLSEILTFWSDRGFQLTTDDDRYYEAMGLRK